MFGESKLQKGLFLLQLARRTRPEPNTPWNIVVLFQVYPAKKRDRAVRLGSRSVFDLILGPEEKEIC